MTIHKFFKHLTILFLSFLFVSGSLVGMEENKSVFQKLTDIENDFWNKKEVNIKQRETESQNKKKVLDHLFDSYFITSNLRTELYGDSRELNKNGLPSNIREAVKGLNFAQLMEIKNKFLENKKIINDEDYDKDDVVKARYLSGYFCARYGQEIEIEGEEGRTETEFVYVPLASGILKPGQQIKDNSYEVHTALHSFAGENMENLYFIPYGFEQKNHIATEKPTFAFKVTEIYRRIDGNLTLVDQEFLNNYSPGKQNDPYKINDYSLVKVKAISEGGKKLDVLVTENIEQYVSKNTESKKQEVLPVLLGEKSAGTEKNSNQKNKVFFVIGMASKPQIGLENNGQPFVVSFSLQNKELKTAQEQRSFNNDPETGFYPSEMKDLLKTEVTADFPSYYGMSGGPVLSCDVTKEEKKCKLVGTLWGSERIFVHGKLVNWKAIINSID